MTGISSKNRKVLGKHKPQSQRRSKGRTAFEISSHLTGNIFLTTLEKGSNKEILRREKEVPKPF